MALKITFECPHCEETISGLLAVWAYYREPAKEDNPILLKPYLCESSGLYGMDIECPKCGEDIEVYD